MVILGRGEISYIMGAAELPEWADPGRRPGRFRDSQYSIYFEARMDTFATGCQFPESAIGGGMPGRADMGWRPIRPSDGHYLVDYE
jgi:hypothetical protein